MKYRQEKEFYTVKELADLLSVTERTIRERLERGEIKGVKLGGKGPWRIASAEVGRLLRGEKPAEDLLELATQFKAQLSIRTPETILIDNLSEPGHYTIPLKRDLFRVTWGSSGEDTRVIRVVKESWSSTEVEINVVVLPDDTLELFCPVEEKPLFPKLLASLSEAAREQFTAWKQRGGDYLRRCMDIHWEISAQARERAWQLINKVAPQDFLGGNFLTLNFSNAIYQRSILYSRTGGKVDIPDKKLYQIRRLSRALYGLYLATKYLARAPAPHPPSPPDILNHLADLHRDIITEWSASLAIAELVELFESLRGTEQAIKEELGHLS